MVRESLLTIISTDVALVHHATY